MTMNEPEVMTVTTDGFSMDYVRFGQGKETLVILPGLSVQSVMPLAGAIARAYAPLTDDFTIYLFDRRRELPDPYPVRQMARDTARALHALGLEQVSVFGASQGGMMAMTLAIEESQLVKKLVLGSTSACVRGEDAGVVERWIALAQEGRAEELYLAFGEAVYPAAMFEQAKDMLAEAAKTVTPGDLARFVILACGARDFDVTEELHIIACPTLVIGDRDDRVLGPDASVLLAERIPAELYLYDGFGHAAYDTAPDYKQRLLAFLTKE